jgi:hypothetical protein
MRERLIQTRITAPDLAPCTLWDDFGEREVWTHTHTRYDTETH